MASTARMSDSADRYLIEGHTQRYTETHDGDEQARGGHVANEARPQSAVTHSTPTYRSRPSKARPRRSRALTLLGCDATQTAARPTRSHSTAQQPR